MILPFPPRCPGPGASAHPAATVTLHTLGIVPAPLGQSAYTDRPPRRQPIAAGLVAGEPAQLVNTTARGGSAPETRDRPASTRSRGECHHLISKTQVGGGCHIKSLENRPPADIVRDPQPATNLSIPQGQREMQRLGLTTDHRDLTETLTDTWSVATRDGVVDRAEQGNITALIMAVASGAAVVDDTIRHATTGLKTGFTSPTAIRQRRDLDRLHGNIVTFPDTTKAHPADSTPPDAA